MLSVAVCTLMELCAMLFTAFSGSFIFPTVPSTKKRCFGTGVLLLGFDDCGLFDNEV